MPTGGWCVAWPGSLRAGVAGATLELLARSVRTGGVIPLVEAGWRHADLLAARELGSRRSTVFRMPPRPLWDLPYAEANAELKRLIKSGISKQAWNLLARVREAGAYRDAGAHQLMEVHPELVFAGLAGAVLPPKSSWAGLSRRRAVLADTGRSKTRAGARPRMHSDAAAVAWRTGSGGDDTCPIRRISTTKRPAIVIWH
jgi:hypothetical protein